MAKFELAKDKPYLWLRIAGALFLTIPLTLIALLALTWGVVFTGGFLTAFLTDAAVSGYESLNTLWGRF